MRLIISITSKKLDFALSLRFQPNIKIVSKLQIASHFLELMLFDIKSSLIQTNQAVLRFKANVSELLWIILFIDK
jgi:hypothetical protein